MYVYVCECTSRFILITYNTHKNNNSDLREEMKHKQIVITVA